MTQLLENIFAVEVPEDARGVEIEKRLDDLIRNGSEHPLEKIKHINSGSYEILFTTKDCTEIQAAIVVEQQKGGGRYKDYLVDGSLTKTGTYLIYGAKNSLHSLLVSHDLNLSKNYLLLKKIS